jgi:hypothetical protein
MIDEGLLNQSLVWEKTGDALVPYRTTIDGHALTVRLGDFPEEAMYALLVDGAVVTEFDDWPFRWRR